MQLNKVTGFTLSNGSACKQRGASGEGGGHGIDPGAEMNANSGCSVRVLTLPLTRWAGLRVHSAISAISSVLATSLLLPHWQPLKYPHLAFCRWKSRLRGKGASRTGRS